MTRHIGRDYLQLRNSLRLAQWQWRWHLQGGTFFTRARDLMDLRDDSAQKHWRKLQFALVVARAKLERAQAVADWFERAWQKLPALLRQQAG